MSRRWLAIPYILLGLVLFACGGGGGGGGTSGGVTYVTDWSHNTPSAVIRGGSQQVNILDTVGKVYATALLNTVTSTADTATFKLPNGSYTLQVLLYSGSDGSSGSSLITGELDYPIVVSNGSSISLKSSVGDAVSGILVTPAAANVPLGQNQTFTATGLNASGGKTFVAPNSINWSTLGGVGSISPSGNYTQTSMGTGSIRAQYTPNGDLGSATATGTSFVPTHTKWTVLVYLSSANSLLSESFLNMNQMEKVANNPDVRFVVEWKQYGGASNGATFDGTRRYQAMYDTTDNFSSQLIQDLGTNVDMANSSTLNDFINWGKTNYPSDHYCLIVWDHGSGWQRSASQVKPKAISEDDQTGNVMEVWDFVQAFGSQHFDIVAFDACDMSMAEVAYQLKDNCDFVVGSEELTPAPGYPYDAVFGPLRDNPTLTPRAFSKNFVNGMIANPLYSASKITQSVIDESQMANLATAISGLGTALTNNVGSLTSVIQSTRSTAQGYDVSSTRYYRDLKDVCLKLEAGTSIPAVLTATGNVKAAIANAVAWEGHNSFVPGSNGISIDFSPGSLFSSEASDYQLMKFGQNTTWANFLTIAP